MIWLSTCLNGEELNLNPLCWTKYKYKNTYFYSIITNICKELTMDDISIKERFSV